MREEDEEEEEEEARLLELEATLISSLSDEMREAYDQLDPEQQIQALEMLRQAADERAMAQSQQQMLMMEQQQLVSRQDQEEMVDLPEEHFLTIALNGEWRQIGGGGRGDTVVFCFVIFFFPFLPSFLPSCLPSLLPSFLLPKICISRPRPPLRLIRHHQLSDRKPQGPYWERRRWSPDSPRAAC
jgi:hypothetical protein